MSFHDPIAELLEMAYPCADGCKLAERYFDNGNLHEQRRILEICVEMLADWVFCVMCWIVAVICAAEGLYMGFHWLFKYGEYFGFQFAAFVWLAGMLPAIGLALAFKPSKP